MFSAIHRPAAVYVNLDAIQHNLLAEKKQLVAGQKLFAVVKANAYGHGAVAVAKIAEQIVDGYCVATLDEGLQLRQAGIVKPILVLGITSPQFAQLAAVNTISLAVGSLSWLKEAQMQLASSTLPLKIHLAIDSGMGRIGFTDEQEFREANQFLQANEHFFVEGMFTHFASADSADLAYFNTQVDRFNRLRQLLTIKPQYIHVANTATSIFARQIKSDIVRFGIGIYGLNPSSNPTGTDLPSQIELEPALSLKSKLSFVKQIHALEGVSYGSTYVAQQDEWVGTIPVGYADGWQRRMQGFKVKVGDTYCPIVGRVCMDQMMVKLPKLMPVGTEVELISADPAAPNSLKAVADFADTIHYEIACLLTDRLPRIYTGELAKSLEK